jgi:hypothetical protein
MLASGLDPDEAIVLYEALQAAYFNLFLDSSLHLLYLIAPLEHNLMPDFKKILQFYDRSKKANSSFANLVDSIGIQHHVLCNRWVFRPPTKNEVMLSSHIVKISGISDSLENISFPVISSAATAVASGSTTATTQHSASEVIVTKPTEKTAVTTSILPKIQKGSLNADEWKMLIATKRLWAAMVLQGLLDGLSYEYLAKEFTAETIDIETIQKTSKMMISKVERFCKEMGWNGLEKVISSFKDDLNFDNIPKELSQLLGKIPLMPRKVAKVLVENRINTPLLLANQTSETVVQYLQLSMGFELQVSL